MSYRNLSDEVKKGLPAGSYLLAASDRFLLAEAAQLVRDLVPAEERDFNFHYFDILASDQDRVSMEQILDVVNTVPFFTGRKYVVVGNIQKLLKKDLVKLGEYLRKPCESTALVLLHQGALKKDQKEQLAGAKQIALDMRESDLPAWIAARARQKGLDLSSEAAAYLLATIGPDLGMLSTEVDKLTLLGHGTVSREDVAEIIEGKRTYGAFDLINALRSRDVRKAFRIYSVLRETEEPYSLLGALNWQYAQSAGENSSPGDREYRLNVFRLLNRADIGIKTGGYYPLELLLVRLLRLSTTR